MVLRGMTLKQEVLALLLDKNKPEIYDQPKLSRDLFVSLLFIISSL